MSLKINKSDKKYMNLAISLAEERVGLTGTNPSVGCVIVKNNEIVSVGQTGIGGVPHAETVAIRNTTKKKLKNSTMYVTLEPCNHYGKTPPCTKQIIKSKIKKVYYGIEDIDNRTSGKSKKIFNSHKIIVKKNLQSIKIKKLYKSYFFLKNEKYPYTTGKIACTNDYFIKSSSKYISNFYSLKFSHLLRYKNQGIMVSSKTINSDNPFLNCRINGLESFSPTRFILDKNLKIKINSNVIKTSNKIKTYIFYNSSSPKINKLKRMGVKFIQINLNDDKNLDILEILKKIKKLNIFYLLVEGGLRLTNFFISKKLFNEFYLLRSNINIKNKNKFKKYRFKNNILKLFSKNETINKFIDKDKIIKYF